MSNKTKFTGALSKYMTQFLNEKHLMGYDYREGGRILHKLDEMSINFDCSKSLPKALVEAFIEKRPHWRKTTQESRIAIVKEFAKYLLRHGIPAYMPDNHSITKSNDVFAPYIFTKSEIAKIFEKLDNLKHRHGSTHHLVYPLLFRLLYGCGLRISEAVALTVADVDLENGLLKVWDSKNHKDRTVPMSASLTERFRTYSEKMHVLSPNQQPYFFNRKKEAYATTSVYHFFRNILWECGISHGGRSNGPRLHDLRHTFSVHCLQRFDEQGISLMAALPLLSTYLGHTCWTATEKYLRLTAECFPSIQAKLDDIYGYLIPMGGDFDEAD